MSGKAVASARRWLFGPQPIVRLELIRILVPLAIVGFMASRVAHADHLWTHLHDSYQTPVSHLLANVMPAWGWTVAQGLVLTFECLAPLLFALRWTRPVALAVMLAMHAMIGLMFGPVIWFSLLMMGLLVGSHAPERWLARAFR